MNPIVCFWIVFGILFFCIAYCNKRYCMLKDLSVLDKPAYSWSRVQLAWWTVIVLSAFIAIMVLEGQAPELRMSTVILLGISAATTATARTIDTSEVNDDVDRHQDKKERILLSIFFQTRQE
ncbi:hypothetical protein [Flavobacterium sp. 3HN19-14]|uniref:hypothetical protein n=1 Tax=Flavobacterium sp. 3HN19-14 TaxID=3448133 RepID=UPI003EE273A6